MTFSEENRNASVGTIREERPLRVAIARAVSEALVQHIPITSDMKMMDYGCGTGLVTMILAPELGRITAIETSRRQLEILDEKIKAAGVRNVRTHQFDMTRELWPGDGFHLILSSMTLHHIEHVDRILHRFVGALFPGGYLAVADLDVEDGSFHAGRDGVEHNGFERDDLSGQFQRAGLVDIDCRTIYSVIKLDHQNQEKAYPMFLMWGRKPTA